VGGRKMTREDKYLLGCLFAINRLQELGSVEFATKVDGKWEEIPWNEVCEWIKKQYAIESEVKE
jgi:hypothetical protein